MKDSSKDAGRWYSQAENDLAYARHGFQGQFYAQVCFQCHQVAEKALKAIHFATLRRRIVLGHSLVKLGGEVGIEGELKDRLGILDQYYIPTRYPNGLPDGAPFEVYTRAQAEEAMATAANVLSLARERISAG